MINLQSCTITKNYAKIDRRKSKKMKGNFLRKSRKLSLKFLRVLRSGIVTDPYEILFAYMEMNFSFFTPNSFKISFKIFIQLQLKHVTTILCDLPEKYKKSKT